MEIEGLRQCVSLALKNGTHGNAAFKKMRHAIIFELNRIGIEKEKIKDMLLDWNKRNEKPLSLGDARRQLHDYTDWFLGMNCKLSCKALEDYCTGKTTCKFYIQKTDNFQKEYQDNAPFNHAELQKYLEEKYPGEAYELLTIIQALRRFQSDKQVTTIYIGFRGIASVIQDLYRHTFSPMQISRRMNILINEKIIEITERGKRGNYTRKSNAYTFLPWRTNRPIITHMCNNEKLINEDIQLCVTK